ncbi:MAG: hypothetical protein M3P18_03220, partial [Actinomycetota bacterium]|nr:hypothetical protein [Actinomycetota bacterium]
HDPVTVRADHRYEDAQWILPSTMQLPSGFKHADVAGVCTDSRGCLRRRVAPPGRRRRGCHIHA